jgi:hypothetical protein
MKSHIKTLALSAIFSIIGLCGTLSTASAQSNGAQISQYLPNVTYMTSFPILSNEGGTKEKPLLKPDSGSKEFSACEIQTKNEYFEFAIIFNDKLQQLISVLFVDDINNSSGAPLTQTTKLN